MIYHLHLDDASVLEPLDSGGSPMNVSVLVIGLFLVAAILQIYNAECVR